MIKLESQVIPTHICTDANWTAGKEKIVRGRERGRETERERQVK